ncbi:hypothetical protein BDD12DRAFT_247788 [Trichophaea hybrida]|nr:hypothetical protein BDD12DRAFT_247788 [Trichophaea hybrida]
MALINRGKSGGYIPNIYFSQDPYTKSRSPLTVVVNCRQGEVLDSNNRIADSSYTGVSHGGVGGEGCVERRLGFCETFDRHVWSCSVQGSLDITGGYRGLRSVKNRSPATMVHRCRFARWVTYSVFAEHWRIKKRDSILLPSYPSRKPDRTRQEEIVMIHSGATGFLSID